VQLVNNPRRAASIAVLRGLFSMGVSLETAFFRTARRSTSFVYHDRMADTPGTMITPLALKDAPDGTLVADARRGDEGAFEELVRRYRNDVYRLACHFVHDREEAWDLSQEVFIKAYRALWRFRGEAQFKTWLMHIVANQCRDHLRQRRLPLDARTHEPVRLVSSDEDPRTERAASRCEPDRVAEARELGQAIEQALESLPHKHRTAFILREYEGLSYEEMARAMRCRMGTVMSRLHHARRKLQDKLTEAGIDEAQGLRASSERDEGRGSLAPQGRAEEDGYHG
ncbi:MAG: sigma-70 family RNA polymerase sigma factor, partial [Candidatus Hydrogenedentes bacterium]|nr:sigma-70 family RNA polymerase sigma factor [Candidatus Hydrogenedentota bacterium]